MSDFFDEMDDFEEIYEVLNVSILSDEELFEEYAHQGKILMELGEVIRPVSEPARVAHSIYGACKIEIMQRGLL